MRSIVHAALAVAALCGVATTAEAKRLAPEERLAKLLDGRVAGEPSDCIYMPSVRSTTVIDKTAIVYKDGSRVWVNRTAHPEDLDEDDILVIRRFDGSNLCRQDMITLADRSTGMFSGAIFLEDFVPYTKAS